jgi:hypothetical protein
MQTTGAALLGVKRWSPVRVPMAVQHGPRRHGFLYLAAVRNGQRQAALLLNSWDTTNSLARLTR